MTARRKPGDCAAGHAMSSHRPPTPLQLALLRALADRGVRGQSGYRCAELIGSSTGAGPRMLEALDARGLVELTANGAFRAVTDAGRALLDAPAFVEPPPSPPKREYVRATERAPDVCGQCAGPISMARDAMSRRKGKKPESYRCQTCHRQRAVRYMGSTGVTP